MNEEVFKAAGKIIGDTYATQAFQSRSGLNKQINELFVKKQCPMVGWSNAWIEHLLSEMSRMDSNNFSHNVGVGERESRIFSDIVSRRHFGFGHGIGRSGDLTEVQPKAAGSSLLFKLTNSMVLHIIKVSGIKSAKDCLVIPVATGLSITMCLIILRLYKPQAKFVIWPRIDQKSCFKAIITAGFEPIVIENVQEEEELRTDLEEIARVIKKVTPALVAAILTTTSCFAPRGIDRLEEIAKMCKEYDIPHIINNAYGLQSSKCTHHIEQAIRVGRVDAFVQSTDKNFMVPVGGAIIAGQKGFIRKLSESYPGRASCSPVMDLFITLLSMGISGYQKLLQERKELKLYLEDELTKVASNFNLKVLCTKNNPISVAMTLPRSSESITDLGSMLFIRGVSGTRVLEGGETKTIQGHVFQGWGTHTNKCSSPYLTAAASIGMKREEVDLFIQRLTKCLAKFCEAKRISEEKHVNGTLSNDGPACSDIELRSNLNYDVPQEPNGD